MIRDSSLEILALDTLEVPHANYRAMNWSRERFCSL
jgi:hypothetical protein